MKKKLKRVQEQTEFPIEMQKLGRLMHIVASIRRGKMKFVTEQIDGPIHAVDVKGNEFYLHNINKLSDPNKKLSNFVRETALFDINTGEFRPSYAKFLDMTTPIVFRVIDGAPDTELLIKTEQGFIFVDKK